MNEAIPNQAYWRSGELARLTGVSPDTLRHYERKGLLQRPRRSTNGYREYPASALNRVNLIRRALAVGFTLDELGRILAVRAKGGKPCHQVREIAAAKLREVETSLAELTALRDELRVLLREWDATLAKTPSQERAGLLESLSEGGSARPLRRSLLTHAPLRRKKENKETQC